MDTRKILWRRRSDHSGGWDEMCVQGTLAPAVHCLAEVSADQESRLPRSWEYAVLLTFYHVTDT